MRKSVLLWGICYALALICLLIIFPIQIFLIGSPFCFVIPAAYVVAVAVLSVLAFRKGACPRVCKRVLFGLLLIPMVAYLAVLLSVGMGWIQWC